MSYSWFVFGRQTPSFDSSAIFHAGPWPSHEDPEDWEDLTSLLDFSPTYWAEVRLENGAIPSELWNAHETLTSRIADSMHGTALNEDGGVLYIARHPLSMPQSAFDGWRDNLFASARKTADLRLAASRVPAQAYG